VWDAELIPLRSTQILKSYFEAWAAILSNAKQIAAKELLFRRRFAGPGEYKAGNRSPIVVINAVLDHTRRAEPVRFVLIETESTDIIGCGARIAARTDTDRREFRTSSSKPPILGDCDTEVRKLIAGERPVIRALARPCFFSTNRLLACR